MKTFFLIAALASCSTMPPNPSTASSAGGGNEDANPLTKRTSSGKVQVKHNPCGPRVAGAENRAPEAKIGVARTLGKTKRTEGQVEYDCGDRE